MKHQSGIDVLGATVLGIDYGSIVQAIGNAVAGIGGAVSGGGGGQQQPRPPTQAELIQQQQLAMRQEAVLQAQKREDRKKVIAVAAAGVLTIGAGVGAWFLLGKKRSAATAPAKPDGGST